MLTTLLLHSLQMFSFLYSVLEERSTLSVVVHALLHVTGLILFHVLGSA